MNKTCDTNVVQSLFILINRPDKVDALENSNTTTNMIELLRMARKIEQGQKSLYVTPQVMKEIEMCESKLLGIVDFTRKNFYMRTTTSPRLVQTIIDLEDEYLREDIYLNDSTRAPQSAIKIEYKEGLPSRADAHIVAENNVLNGHPLYTLNEKHLVCIENSDKPSSPKRSAAIINKNKLFVSKYVLHKVAKKNLKKLTSTTFKVRHINRSTDDLINAMIQEL